MKITKFVSSKLRKWSCCFSGTRVGFGNPKEYDVSDDQVQNLRTGNEASVASDDLDAALIYAKEGKAEKEVYHDAMAEEEEPVEKEMALSVITEKPKNPSPNPKKTKKKAMVKPFEKGSLGYELNLVKEHSKGWELGSNRSNSGDDEDFIVFNVGEDGADVEFFDDEEKNHHTGNADFDAALRFTEDEADYMAVKRVGQEEAELKLVKEHSMGWELGSNPSNSGDDEDFIVFNVGEDGSGVEFFYDQEKNHYTGNADLDPALKCTEDEADYMAVKRVGKEEAELKLVKEHLTELELESNRPKSGDDGGDVESFYVEEKNHPTGNDQASAPNDDLDATLKYVDDEADCEAMNRIGQEEVELKPVKERPMECELETNWASFGDDGGDVEYFDDQERNHPTGNDQASVRNADLDAALKYTEDESDYMVMNGVEQDETVENKEFIEEVIWKLEDDEIVNDDNAEETPKKQELIEEVIWNLEDEEISSHDDAAKTQEFIEEVNWNVEDDEIASDDDEAKEAMENQELIEKGSLGYELNLVKEHSKGWELRSNRSNSGDDEDFIIFNVGEDVADVEFFYDQGVEELEAEAGQKEEAENDVSQCKKAEFNLTQDTGWQLESDWLKSRDEEEDSTHEVGGESENQMLPIESSNSDESCHDGEGSFSFPILTWELMESPARMPDPHIVEAEIASLENYLFESNASDEFNSSKEQPKEPAKNDFNDNQIVTERKKQNRWITRKHEYFLGGRFSGVRRLFSHPETAASHVTLTVLPRWGRFSKKGSRVRSMVHPRGSTCEPKGVRVQNPPCTTCLAVATCVTSGSSDADFLY